MSEPQLDWTQAEVRNGKLTVSVAGDPPRGWKDTFEQTARLLSGGEWDNVTLKKRSVRVVQQANATHEAPEDEPQDEADTADEATAGSERDTATDAEMTERFRSFA